MLKKLLSLLGIGKDEEAKVSSQNTSTIATKDSKDDSFDEDEEKIKVTKKVVKKKDYDEDNEDDDHRDDDDEEWPEEEKGQRVAVELDPVTIHGKNYTKAEFDEEVEKRFQAHIADDKTDGEDVLQEDIDN